MSNKAELSRRCRRSNAQGPVADAVGRFSPATARPAGGGGGCVSAAGETLGRHWIEWARQFCRWFPGSNDLSLPPADSVGGGCGGGLHVAGGSYNPGAESTRAFVSSTIAVVRMDVREVPSVDLAVIK